MERIQGMYWVYSTSLEEWGLIKYFICIDIKIYLYMSAFQIEVTNDTFRFSSRSFFKTYTLLSN